MKADEQSTCMFFQYLITHTYVYFLYMRFAVAYASQMILETLNFNTVQSKHDRKHYIRYYKK